MGKWLNDRIRLFCAVGYSVVVFCATFQSEAVGVIAAAHTESIRVKVAGRSMVLNHAVEYKAFGSLAAPQISIFSAFNSEISCSGKFPARLNDLVKKVLASHWYPKRRFDIGCQLGKDGMKDRGRSAVVDKRIAYERLISPAALQVDGVAKLDEDIWPFHALKGFLSKISLPNGGISGSFASLGGIPSLVGGTDGGLGRLVSFRNYVSGMDESAQIRNTPEPVITSAIQPATANCCVNLAMIC